MVVGVPPFRLSNFFYDVLTSGSKDVLNRWTYPMVPETNFMENSFYYYQRRAEIFRGEDVTIYRYLALM